MSGVSPTDPNPPGGASPAPTSMASPQAPVLASPTTEGSPNAGDLQPPAPVEEEVQKPTIDPTKDLWQNIALNVKDAAMEQSDQTVLLVGGKGAGKTTLIKTMLGKAGKSEAKPTTALEYAYGKREDRNATQIAHFWELAHDGELASLADIVLSGETIHSTTAVLVVDCSQPQLAFATLEAWLRRIDRRVQDVFQKMRSKNSSTPDKMLKRQRERIGLDHPDLPKMRVCGLSILVVAAKLDQSKMDTVKMKLMARTLRFMAHLYGASVCFTSTQDREAVRFSALLNHLVFSTPFDNKHLLVDPEKGGVLILAGKDSFGDIGDAVPTTPPGFKPCGDSELDRWKAPFDDQFPPGKAAEGAVVDDEFQTQLFDVEGGYGDAAIDTMRKQKDEELEMYKRSLKAKEKEPKARHGGEE